MKPIAGGRWRGLAVAAALLAGAGTTGAEGPPALYAGEGGWAAVSGWPADAAPTDGSWNFAEGLWVGRLPAGLQRLEWGTGAAPQGLEAQPAPPPPVALPAVRNAFGACAVRSLSMRYDSVVRSRKWSLVFAGQDEEPDFEPLALPGRPPAPLALELEDVATGQRWPLRPTRRGREGGVFPKPTDPRFYGGTLPDRDVDWTLLVVPLADGRLILQGQLQLLQSDERRLRLRLAVRAGAPGIPVLQADCPPAILAVAGTNALALFPDLAEPRRYRVAGGAPDAAVVAFDLALAKTTGNFPRRATVSLEVAAWTTADAETAQREAAARLARAGGAVPLPDAVRTVGFDDVPAFAPASQRLAHPGGFRDGADALRYLALKASALFRDADWAASAFQCAAVDARGEPQVALSDDEALVAVNADPDLDAMLEWGQNRGLTLLERVRRSGSAAVWIRAGTAAALDHGARALYLCDYPAVWEEGSPLPAVDVRHAEAELIASLACVLKTAGTCLLVEDAGPLAPFTTYHADALVCASADSAEMRRQRALAGPRPVVWIAENPGPEAVALARELGFVTPGQIGED